AGRFGLNLFWQWGLLMNVQSILGVKGSEVATTTQTATLADAIDELGRRRIGALVVSGGGRADVRNIAEGDIGGATATYGPDPLARAAGSGMSPDVATCTGGDGVDRLGELMTARRSRHPPVVDDHGQLSGIISIGDVVRARLT